MNMELILRISIILLSAIGLLFLATNTFRRKPRGEFLIYFTNMSNMFVLLYFLFNINNSVIQFLVTIYITFTMLVFNLVIYPMLVKLGSRLKDIGTDMITSSIAHIIVPILVLIYWFKYPVNIEYGDLVYIFPLPLLYLFFAFWLGKSGYKIRENITNYIYPFLDLDKLGIRKVFVNIIILFVLLVLLSYSLIYFR